MIGYWPTVECESVRASRIGLNHVHRGMLSVFASNWQESDILDTRLASTNLWTLQLVRFRRLFYFDADTGCLTGRLMATRKPIDMPVVIGTT